VSNISIAMATYNGERYIEQQLHSLASQVLLPAELVITDDGSQDSTLDIVARFAASAPFPVHIHRNPVRLGYRANFMHNAALCKSELISFCDQDDVWRPNKLSRASASFADPEVLLVYSNAQLVDGDGRRLGMADLAKAPPYNPPSTLHPYSWGLGFLLMFHRSLLTMDHLWAGSMDAVEPENPMAHDMWYFFLASVFGCIVYLDEELVDYRQHASNTVGFRPRGSRWEQIRAKVLLGADEYSRIAKVSWSRKAILDTALLELAGDQRSKAMIASALYEQYARRFEYRAKIYSDRRFISRVRSLLSLVGNGAYGTNNAWGLSFGSLMKDALLVAGLGMVGVPASA
jgi:glycosyltransferase involved in cell wall biosynthesis